MTIWTKLLEQFPLRTSFFCRQQQRELLEELQEEMESNHSNSGHGNRPKLEEGIISLYRLMSFQLEQAKSTSTDLIYLNIAALRANDVFVSDTSLVAGFSKLYNY